MQRKAEIFNEKRRDDPPSFTTVSQLLFLLVLFIGRFNVNRPSGRNIILLGFFWLFRVGGITGFGPLKPALRVLEFLGRGIHFVLGIIPLLLGVSALFIMVGRAQ